MRLPIESRAVITGDPLIFSGVRTYRDIFPLGGEGWHKIRLLIHPIATHTTATNPIVLGAYNIVKNIIVRTSKNETICQMPGLALYYLNWILDQVEPWHMNNAGTTATAYCAVIDIPFSHGLLARKEDLVVDTGRYSSIELEITLGGAASFFGAGCEGNAVMSGTLDIEIFRCKSTFEATGKPLALPYLKHLAPYLLTRGYTDIESAEDLTLFGFFAIVQDMAASAAYDPILGVPYSGVPAWNMDTVTFRDNVISYLHMIPLDFWRQERKNYTNLDFADEARLAGMYSYIFIREGSIFNSYWTGQKSEIRLENSTVALGTPTTPQIDVVIFGMREMRA